VFGYSGNKSGNQLGDFTVAKHAEDVPTLPDAQKHPRHTEDSTPFLAIVELTGEAANGEEPQNQVSRVNSCERLEHRCPTTGGNQQPHVLTSDTHARVLAAWSDVVRLVPLEYAHAARSISFSAIERVQLLSRDVLSMDDMLMNAVLASKGHLPHYVLRIGTDCCVFSPEPLDGRDLLVRAPIAAPTPWLDC
jgi:hypothetical protein